MAAVVLSISAATCARIAPGVGHASCARLIAREPRGEPRLVHRRRAPIPIRCSALSFGDEIESRPRSYLIGSAARDPVFSFVMLLGRRGSARSGSELDRVEHRPTGLYIGLAQALALMPGVSRSGITISAGLFRGTSTATRRRGTRSCSSGSRRSSSRGCSRCREIGHATGVGRPDDRRHRWRPSSPATWRSPGCFATWRRTRSTSSSPTEFRWGSWCWLWRRRARC